jgi:hypothetical protein
MLPRDTTPGEIRAAARAYDANPAAFKAATKFAVIIDGKRYPPKAIISLATGLNVRMFSGGVESNRWLAKRGFEIVSTKEGTQS